MGNPILSNSLVSAGPYEVYYRAANENNFITLGSTKAEDGVRERILRSGKEIRESALGEGSVVDFVYDGQERFLEFTLQEFKRDQVLKLIYDHNAAFPGGVGSIQQQFHMGQPGVMASQYAGSIKLKPFHPNTPSRSGTASDILWYYCAAMASGEETELMMKADLLVAPVVLRLFPTVISGSNPPQYSFGQLTNSI